MLTAVAYLIALFALGWMILGASGAKFGMLLRAGLAYPLGAGCFTLSIFLAASFGMPINLISGSIVFVALLVPIVGLHWRRGGSLLPATIEPPRLNTTQIVLIGMTVVTLLAASAAAVYLPPYAWDSLANWGLKGKLIAATGALAPQALAAVPFYPLNIPLQMTFLFLFGGSFLQIIFPVYFLSLALVFYANLRQWAGITLSLACTLFLSITPIVQYQATIAYANLPFAFYYAGSAIFLYRFLKEKNSIWLVLSALLIGFAGWTRSESLLYFAINIAVLILFQSFSRESFKRVIAYLGIYAILWAPWTLYSRLAGYGDYLVNSLGGLTDLVTGRFNGPMLLEILNYAGSRAPAVEIWGFLWIGLIVALVIGAKHLRAHAPLLLLIALNLGGLIYAYYSAGATGGASIDWFLTTGFDRLALHWAPLVVFYLGLTIEASGFSKVDMLPFRVRIDPYLVLLVFFSLFAIGPLLGPGYFWGAHDGRHSVYFLFEFDRVIQDGIFYPRWLPDFTFGYGYPFFNIYGPGAFYVGETLHLLGLDFVTATKVVFALAILLSGPGMFGFVKRLTGSSQAAFLSGLAYIYMPYHLADIYVRAALEESVALIFLPLVFWGFYETTLHPKRLTVVATAMMYGAMMFSHSGITLLATVVLGLWVLFLLIGEVRKKEPNLRSRAFMIQFIRSGLAPLGALLLGLALVAVFFIPAILEYSYVRTDQWIGNYYDYANHFSYLFQLFDPSWGFGISVPGPHDGMSFQLGVVPVLLAIFAVVKIFTNPNGTRRFWIFFLTMTLVIAFLTLGPAAPIWKVLSFLAFEQFPWRLEAFTTLSLAVLAGAVALTQESVDTARGWSLSTILLGLLILFGSYPYVTAQMQLTAQEGPVGIQGLFRFQQSAGEMTGSTAWVKDIPIWSEMANVYFAGKRVKSKIDFTNMNIDDPDNVWIGVDQTGKGLRANGERVFVASQQDDLIVTFNTFYYPGWRAYLTPEFSDEIVRELKIEPVGELGRIQVHVPKGRYFLILRFDDTPPRTAGEWISGFSLLFALGVLLWDVRVRRRQPAATTSVQE